MKEAASSTLPPCGLFPASAMIRFKGMLHGFWMLGHSRGRLIMNLTHKPPKSLKYWFIIQFLTLQTPNKHDSLSRSIMAEGSASQVADEGGFGHFPVTASPRVRVGVWTLWLQHTDEEAAATVADNWWHFQAEAITMTTHKTQARESVLCPSLSSLVLIRTGYGCSCTSTAAQRGCVLLAVWPFVSAVV